MGLRQIRIEFQPLLAMEFRSVDPCAARIEAEVFSCADIRECRVCEGEFGICGYGAVQRGDSSVKRFKVFRVAFAKPFEKFVVSAGVGRVAVARLKRFTSEFSCQSLGHAPADFILDFENTLERKIVFFSENHFTRMQIKRLKGTPPLRSQLLNTSLQHVANSHRTANREGVGSTGIL